MLTRIRGDRLEVIVGDDGDGVPTEDEATTFLRLLPLVTP